MKFPPFLLGLMLASTLIELSFLKPSGFWFLLAPLFAYGWCIVSVLFHEVGHGAMAQCLGWRVVRLEAGSMIPLGTRGNECWKALSYAKAGRLPEATACAANAERLDPGCFLLPQVRASLRKSASGL